MEEEKKELVQEEKDEQYLKLKKSNNRKKAVIIILLFIIVLAGLIIFIFFTDKKEEPKKEENKQQEQKEETKPEDKPEEQEEQNEEFIKINGLNSKRLNENNQEFVVNGNSIKLKYNDYTTFVNDKEIEDVYATHVIVQDKYLLLLEEGCQCAACVKKYIDEDGIIKNIINKEDPDSHYQYNNFKSENGNVVATAEYCPCLDGCPSPYSAKYVYENKTLSVAKNN